MMRTEKKIVFYFAAAVKNMIKHRDDALSTLKPKGVFI